MFGAYSSVNVDLVDGVFFEMDEHGNMRQMSNAKAHEFPKVNRTIS